MRQHPLRNTFILAGWLALWLVIGARESQPLALLAAFTTNLGPHLLAAAGTVAGFWALGGPLRSRVVPDFADDDPTTRALLETGLGLSALLLITSLLGSFGLLFPIVSRGIFIAGLCAVVLRLKRSRTGPKSSNTKPLYVGIPLLAAAVLLPCLFTITAPLVGPDEVQYHRRFVEQILRTGGVPGDAEDPLSSFALGLHCLASIPASLTGVSALRPFGFLLGLAGILGGERLFRRTFGPGKSWIYLGVVLSSVSLLRALPLFTTDLPLALLVALIALLALDWTQSPGDPGGRPWAIALLGGAALSIKFTAPIFIAPLYIALAVAILWDEKTTRRGHLLLITAVSAAVPLAFALPWLIKNQLTSGHPLYPLLGMAFPETAPTAFAFNFDAHYGPGKSLTAMIRSPWDLFIMGREFDRRQFMGRMGMWPLVALPGIVLTIRRNRQALLLVLASLLGFFLWASVLLRAVYLLPLWPILAAVTAGGLMQFLPKAPRPSAKIAAGLLGAVLTAVVVAENAPAWSNQLDSIAVAVGEETNEEFIQRSRAEDGAIRWIRRNSQPDEAVAQFWHWGWWDSPNRLIWPGAEDFTPLRSRLVKLGSADAILKELRSNQVRWVIYRRPILLRQSYPTVTDKDWEIGFTSAMELSDQLIHRHLNLRYEDGPFQVYEVPSATGNLHL